MSALQTAIVGGTGYTGAELVRLLLQHPRVELCAVTSRGEAGTPLAEYFPGLQGHTDLAFSAPDTASLSAFDLVFFATPSGVAMEMAPPLLEKNVRVIDLSADFRLRDAAEWEQWYGQPHACPALLQEAVYGLPEQYRDAIRRARLLANPGCYPTAVQLGLLPLLEQGLVADRGLVADAKSGASGAGRSQRLDLLQCEVAENVRAYAASGHRHLPEILQGLRAAAGGSDLALTFVPHLMPMIRGIHATLYTELLDPATDVQALFEQRYAGEPFVDVLAPGCHPETRSVHGSNVCRIAIHRPGDGTRVVVLSVIDNLIKGAAGQAVQNMNLMFDWPEAEGLGLIPWLP